MEMSELKYHALSFLENKGYKPELQKEQSEKHGSVKEGVFPNRSFNADIDTRVVIAEMRVKHIHVQNNNRSRARVPSKVTVYLTGLFGIGGGYSRLNHCIIEITVPEENVSPTGEKGGSVHTLMNDLHSYLDTKRNKSFKYQMITYAGPLVGIRAIVT